MQAATSRSSGAFRLSYVTLRYTVSVSDLQYRRARYTVYVGRIADSVKPVVSLLTLALRTRATSIHLPAECAHTRPASQLAVPCSVRAHHKYVLELPCVVASWQCAAAYAYFAIGVTLPVCFLEQQLMFERMLTATPEMTTMRPHSDATIWPAFMYWYSR